MTNRLKFRVWDKLEKRFIYPDKGYQGHYVLTLNGQFQNLQNGSGGDEYVVQQFTGEYDKNKKEIYEGDLFGSFKSDNNKKWEPVEFKDGQWQANFRGARVFSLYETFGDIATGDYPEVIGNIFQNPELLNK
jgi:uncharacterized phage protein (TIGR01671 family)